MYEKTQFTPLTPYPTVGGVATSVRILSTCLAPVDGGIVPPFLLAMQREYGCSHLHRRLN